MNHPKKVLSIEEVKQVRKEEARREELYAEKESCNEEGRHTV